MTGVEGLRAGLDDLARRYSLDDLARERLTVLLAGITDDPRSPTTVRDPVSALHQHLADSLVGLEIEGVRMARRLADLGSGAGLPGLALAVALPATEVHLVDSQARKCAFMASLSAKLGLSNVRITWARAEEWHAGIGQHDLVVTRALASQAVVLEYAAPLLKLGAVLVQWRGSSHATEEASALRAGEELGLRWLETRRVVPFEGARDRNLHIFEKVSETPSRFPRRAGVARKRPLGS